MAAAHLAASCSGGLPAPGWRSAALASASPSTGCPRGRVPRRPTLLAPSLAAGVVVAARRRDRSWRLLPRTGGAQAQSGDAASGGVRSPVEEWDALSPREESVTVTEDLIGKAKERFERKDTLYLFHVAAVAFPHLGTRSAARNAVRRQQILVDGRSDASDAFAPAVGAVLTARVGAVERPMPRLEQRLARWNRVRSRRPEAQLRVLFSDPADGWAVVNKPPGMHSSPCGFNMRHLTFEAYLPALVPPPESGTRRSPGVCHRLDFRVGGPVLVATAEEAMRALSAAFQQRLVRKEYRAVVCGRVGEPGEAFCVDAPLDGSPARTDVEVLRLARCPGFGWLSEVALRPLQGRFRQLRRHCAEALGAPIANEDRQLFEAAAPAWRRRHGSPLPDPGIGRRSGELCLQAVAITVPRPLSDNGELVTVRTDVSAGFEKLMQRAASAWEGRAQEEASGPSSARACA